MPTMSVTCEFTFDSAHQLTNYYGKCERLHGHTYNLQVTLEGEIQSNGMVIDFVVLRRIVTKQILEKLDHRYLNDILENPSAERLAVWIWDQLKDLSSLLRQELNDPNLSEDLKTFLSQEDQSPLTISQEFQQKLRLTEIRLAETPKSWVIYRG